MFCGATCVILYSRHSNQKPESHFRGCNLWGYLIFLFIISQENKKEICNGMDGWMEKRPEPEAAQNAFGLKQKYQQKEGHKEIIISATMILELKDQKNNKTTTQKWKNYMPATTTTQHMSWQHQLVAANLFAN